MNSITFVRSPVALLLATAILAACGGGSDDSDSSPTPTPTPPPAAADTAFATPKTESTTVEAGAITQYSFAQHGDQQTAGNLSFSAAKVSFDATLAANQDYAGTAIRFFAPGNTGDAPQKTFDGTSFSKIKIQLASTTDATLKIKLQPNPISTDGCTATATAIVDATAKELTIDLNDTSFPLPSYCSAGTAVNAVKAGLYAIDFVNDASAAGKHDVIVGTVKLVK